MIHAGFFNLFFSTNNQLSIRNKLLRNIMHTLLLIHASVMILFYFPVM